MNETAETTPKTVKETVPEYLEYLKSQGKKESTINTIGRLLKLVVTHQGEQKQMGKILPAHIAGFFKSDLATKVKDRPMAEPTKLQIRRVTRQFLVWAFETGIIVKLPLPKDEMKLVKSVNSNQGSQANQGGQTEQEGQTEPDNPPEPEETVTVQDNCRENTDSSEERPDNREEGQESQDNSEDSVNDN